MAWQLLRKLDQKDLEAFLTFAWGRSRLPRSDGDFEQKFQLESHSGSYGQPQSEIDKAFPIGHTCFFSMELPKYSDIKFMESRMLYAFRNTGSIDTDFNENFAGVRMEI